MVRGSSGFQKCLCDCALWVSQSLDDGEVIVLAVYCADDLRIQAAPHVRQQFRLTNELWPLSATDPSGHRCGRDWAQQGDAFGVCLSVIKVQNIVHLGVQQGPQVM